MFKATRFVMVVFAVCVNSAFGAQDQPSARAAADGVRFLGGAGVAKIRVEVLSPVGGLLYDSGWEEGNLLDWAFGQPLSYGSYPLNY